MTPTRYESEEQKWQAVVNRDSAAEGQFWLGVRTTGIFCRPGCPARTPLRENVAFFDSLIDALRSGLRPCKRCHPLGQSVPQMHVDLVVNACRRILGEESMPSLGSLAESASLSPAHFQKLFKRIVGVTPAQFANATRAQRIQAALPMADSVTRAAHDAGFTSTAQFYESAGDAIGMAPKAFRNKGEGERIRWAVVDTWLGQMLIAATERGICRIAFGENTDELVAILHRDFANACLLEPDEAFARLVEGTVAAIGTDAAASLPLDLRGTAFQAKVWHTLRRIPLGSTVTYTDVAEEIGQPSAVRAVATACASNTIAVLVPCHRVIGKDGSLTGYRWGVERKRALLEREAGGGAPQR